MADERTIQADEPLLLTVRDVARWLRISTRQVWRLLSGGKLPRPLRLGGAVRWQGEELRRWLSAGCPEVSEWTGT